MNTLWRSDPVGVRYVSCSRCGLSLTLKSGWPAMEHCPRCVPHESKLVERSNLPTPLTADAASVAAGERAVER